MRPRFQQRGSDLVHVTKMQSSFAQKQLGDDAKLPALAPCYNHVRIGALDGKAADAGDGSLVPAGDLTRCTAWLARHAQPWLHAWLRARPQRQCIADVRIERCQVQDFWLCRACHPARQHKLLQTMAALDWSCRVHPSHQKLRMRKLHTVLQIAQVLTSPQLALHGPDGF